MDVLLGKVTQQAMNYAIRSGITITASYAIKQSARLLKAAEATSEREELQDLQERLDSKIRIISPAIDMIELISARGNTSLESAVSLTKQLRWEIQRLGQRLQTAATAEELFQRRSAKAHDRAQHALELKQIAQAIRKLLTKIEDAVPLINLAITASGASLSSSLPSTVSPSRLLQASTFLTAGDSQYAISNSECHIRPQSENEIRESTWKEVIHKAIVKPIRVSLDSLNTLPNVKKLEQTQNHSSKQELNDDIFTSPIAASARADEFAYQLVIVEDLNDDRAHTFEDDKPQPGPYEDIDLAGIREALPIHEISKIFYADTGKILNIGSEGEANSPILLLKRDPNAIPPRRMTNKYGEAGDVDDIGSSVPQSPVAASGGDNKSAAPSPRSLHRSSNVASTQSKKQLVPPTNPWRLPADLDPEWMAFEVYTEADDSDTETENESTPSTKLSRPSRTPSLPVMTSALSRLNINTPTSSSSTERSSYSQQTPNPSLPPIRSSLSLLEMLLRLLSLQQFQQTPHLSIPDELLTFFLSESASTGAASNDAQERKRLREEARRRVGFDPYDESPVKRRGEDYQYYGGETGGSETWNAERHEFTDERYGTPVGSVRYDDEGYNTRSTTVPPSSGQPPFTPRRAASDSPAERWFRKQPLRDAVSTSTGQSPGPPGSGNPPAMIKRRSSGGYRLRDTSAAVEARRGSPLARPGTNLTDEGLGTSPSVEKEGNG